MRVKVAILLEWQFVLLGLFYIPNLEFFVQIGVLAWNDLLKDVVLLGGGVLLRMK
jgi:hypothetical protein